jgi:hypothetical protein
METLMADTASVLTPIDFVVITCKTRIHRPVKATWARIGQFEDAGKFLSVPCKLDSEVEGIGSVRKVGDSILEVMVGETEFSYSYAQIAGPMAQFSYHGCVSLTSENNERCELTYTITYDQAHWDLLKKQSELERISLRFQGAAEAMKLEAERLPVTAPIKL